MKIIDNGEYIRFEPENKTEIFELGQIAANLGGYLGSFETDPGYLLVPKRKLLLYLIGE